MVNPLLMKKNAVFVLSLFVCLGQASAQLKNTKPQVLERPKLVVGIVVDQMRWDYLYRYYDRYGTGGFKHLLREGFSCENTYIDYVPTHTAIGHSTVYTGSVPAIHGITGNNFMVQKSGQIMYCTEDSTVQTVGSSSVAGHMSPANLKASTIADELKLATNFHSKVIGVALKDRGSILPAGHAADAAYWFDDASGNFISSTFYLKDLPQWVNRFNDQKLPLKYLRQNWNTLYPIETYVQSTPDENPYEGKYKGTNSASFPVNTSQLMDQGAGLIRSTPYGNTLTIDMAMAAIENEQLGKDAITDMLTVSFSSTDYIGHQFGVNSIEVEDTYLRLDRDLAAFLQYLDAKVGAGAYTVFLTADHAAANNVAFLSDHKIPAGLWNTNGYLKELNALLKSKYGQDKIVRSFMNNQVHLNYTLIKAAPLDEAAIRKDCKDFLEGKKEIAWVVDLKDLANTAVPAMIKERVINGYNRERSGALTIITNPSMYGGTVATGSGHTAWNPYDSHIPLLWMGWGIRQGKSNEPVHMTDIAPTLAALLRVQEPSGSIGKPLREIFK